MHNLLICLNKNVMEAHRGARTVFSSAWHATHRLWAYGAELRLTWRHVALRDAARRHVTWRDGAGKCGACRDGTAQCVERQAHRRITSCWRRASDSRTRIRHRRSTLRGSLWWSWAWCRGTGQWSLRVGRCREILRSWYPLPLWLLSLKTKEKSLL